MELEVKYIPIGDIKPYKGNAKKHPKKQIDQIVKSIEDMGFLDPIGIWNGEIVEGHGRYLAAKKLKLKTVPVIFLDDLTDEQRRAYTLIHNKLTMNSDFDLALLTDELLNISKYDMAEYGFVDPEIFSADDIEDFNSFNEFENDNEWFTAIFTFPTANKKQIQKYLRKYKQEITDDIIKKAVE